jgi:hypothetical protein
MEISWKIFYWKLVEIFIGFFALIMENIIFSTDFLAIVELDANDESSEKS